MKVIAIDDEEDNIDILTTSLELEGFEAVTADNGETGWNVITQNPDAKVILLDRMMPKMNGMELLKRIKTNNQYKNIPVIMQTALASQEDIKEGIDAGAYYYLTKPFKHDLLISIVNAAINDNQYIENITNEVKRNQQTIGLMTSAYFEFKTIEEAQNLALFIANSYPDPERVILGLSEMMINAVEHGNLAIGYKEKGQLLMEKRLSNEINKRIELPQYKKKKVYVSFERSDDEIAITIADEGDGFNAQDFLDIQPGRATSPNGRGIMMARTISFDDIDYSDKGNQVCCKVSLKKTSKTTVG